MYLNEKIAVVIPTYKATRHILSVINLIGPEIDRVYVVDDCCPEKSGDFVSANCRDARLLVIKHSENKGVGGAVTTGYKLAIEHGMSIIVKLDSDGQMDPCLILDFVIPIATGEADYTKGNRFYNLEKILTMPKIRIVGNAFLSFMCKLSSGYWNIFDSTNGYTAIHVGVASQLPLYKISQRFFFESDMLFRLNTLRAVVVDVPMDARYENEISNLRPNSIIFEFLLNHFKNFFKRIFYNYYLRDMSLASIELPVGTCLITFGISYGAYHWWLSANMGLVTPLGTIMFSVLPILTGIQCIFSFIAYDIASVPTRPRHRRYFASRKIN